MTIGFMASYYENQKTDIGGIEKKKIKKYSQKNIHIKIVNNSFCVCMKYTHTIYIWGPINRSVQVCEYVCVYIYVCVCVCVCVCVRARLWKGQHTHGAFNKIPDIFVQAFKIVVDYWKFTILLLYILWDDWPIFMISTSNQQLQQQLEYTLLKPDCHS